MYFKLSTENKELKVIIIIVIIIIDTTSPVFPTNNSSSMGNSVGRNLDKIVNILRKFTKTL